MQSHNGGSIGSCTLDSLPVIHLVPCVGIMYMCVYVAPHTVGGRTENGDCEARAVGCWREDALEIRPHPPNL